MYNVYMYNIHIYNDYPKFDIVQIKFKTPNLALKETLS